MIEFTQNLAIECAECGRELRHLETLGTVQQTGTIQAVPCECAAKPGEVVLREGVRNESGPGGVRLVDEHGVMIEVSGSDELVEIMWLGEDGKPKPSPGQSVHPLDMLHALTLAGWTLEGRIEK
jgi:hypothetical protein